MKYSKIFRIGNYYYEILKIDFEKWFIFRQKLCIFKNSWYGRKRKLMMNIFRIWNESIKYLLTACSETDYSLIKMINEMKKEMC